MWLFVRYGFFSISIFDGKFTVRARMKKHLEALQTRFPGLTQYPIETHPDRDYRYRIYVPRPTWETVMDELVREQEWSNFKQEVARFGGYDAYEDALHKVWKTMFRVQQLEAHGEDRQ